MYVADNRVQLLREKFSKPFKCCHLEFCNFGHIWNVVPQGPYGEQGTIYFIMLWGLNNAIVRTRVHGQEITG